MGSGSPEGDAVLYIGAMRSFDPTWWPRAGVPGVLLASALLLLTPLPAAASRGLLPLADCRLEHPLRLGSVAASCGTLSVAEDPEHPTGARIALAVAVVPALDRRTRAAPLFVLAGGPGQAASDLYAMLAGAFARIHRDRDIVLLDQRGTGRSAPLRCDYPEDWQQLADTLPGLRAATLACLAKYGPRVRWYTSSIAVRDLDAVRRALGYPRIDLYGASYGTRMAQLYMRRYPQATEAVILDGVTYPQQAIGLETPLDAERALRAILDRCRAARECAEAFPELEQQLAGLRTRFGPQRQRVSFDDPTSGEPRTLDFGHDLLGEALRFMSYSSSQAALLPTLIRRGAAGDLAPLAAQSLLVTGVLGEQLASGMQNTVVCSEDVPFFALSAPMRARLRQTFLGLAQLDALAQVCALWPRGPVDPDLHAPLRSDVPTLLLSGEADPVTPPADAERAAQGLTHHRLLVLAGEGHGQAGTGCVPRMMAEFLIEPDANALDATCVAQHRPAPFFLGPTGPAP